MFVVELLVEDPGFRNGWWWGVAVTAVALVASSLYRWWRPSAQELPLAAVAAVAAALVALDRTGPSVLLSDQLVRGVLASALLPLAAGIAAQRLGLARWWPAVALVAAVPGAILVGDAAALANGWWWVPPLVVGTVVVGGAALVDYDAANARSGLAPVLLALTALATWTTVPDTEQILVVVGAFLPVAALGLPVARICEGAAGYGVVGLLAWVAAVGGRGRPGAVVGAVACLGILAAEPVARRVWRGRAVTPDRPWSTRGVASIGVHAVVVLLAARVAGLERGADVALGLAAVVLLLGTCAMVVVLRPRRRGRGGRRRSPTTDRGPVAATRRDGPRNMQGA